MKAEQFKLNSQLSDFQWSRYIYGRQKKNNAKLTYDVAQFTFVYLSCKVI